MCFQKFSGSKWILFDHFRAFSGIFSHFWVIFSHFRSFSRNSKTPFHLIRSMVKNQIGWGDPTERFTFKVMKPMPKEYLKIIKAKYRSGINMVVIKWENVEKADIYVVNWGKTSATNLKYQKIIKKGDIEYENAKITETMLKNLSEGQKYYVEITAKQNNGDTGEPYLFDIKTATTVENRPPVENVTILPLTSSTVQVHWKDPFYAENSRQHQNMSITEYFVHYREKISGRHVKRSDELGNYSMNKLQGCYDFETPCNVTGLTPFTDYEFYVSCEQDGEHSATASSKTLGDVPTTMIDDLRMAIILDSQKYDETLSLMSEKNNKFGESQNFGKIYVFSAKIMFSKPVYPFGNLESYLVEITDTETNQIVHSIKTESTGTVVTDLVSGKEYEAAVRFTNEFGDSPFSDVIRVTIPKAKIVFEEKVEKSGFTLGANESTYWLLLILLGSLCLLQGGFVKMSRKRAEMYQKTRK